MILALDIVWPNCSMEMTMWNRLGSLLTALLVSLILVGIPGNLSGQVPTPLDGRATNEYPDFTLSFQYIEGSNLALPNKKPDPKTI